jgi:hypothetical protein
VVLVVAGPVEDVVPAPDVGVVDGSSSATPPETLPATPERDCAAGDVVEVLALPTPEGVVPPGPSGVESLVPVWGWLVDRSAQAVVVVAPPDELPSDPQAPTPTTRANAQPHAARVWCLRLMPTGCPMRPSQKPAPVARSRPEHSRSGRSPHDRRRTPGVEHRQPIAPTPRFPTLLTRTCWCSYRFLVVR